jgi:hypothetical protein
VRLVPFVKYDRLPRFFSAYDEMLAGTEDPVTMTRLLAMACGVHVFNDFPKKYRSFYGGENPDAVDEPRAFVERHHDPVRIARELVTIYENLLKKRR